MQTLDLAREFAVVYGVPGVRFEQDGKHFNHQGLPVGAVVVVEKAPEKGLEKEIPTDELESGKAFLRTVLARGPVSKSVIYKATEQNNQTWDWVKKAAASLNIVRFQYQKMEHWKLPQED